MKHLPDAATLDALVIGTDGPDDQEAWEALVKLPGGAEAWSAAVSRRRRMGRLAFATRGRPWLARAMLALARAARELRVVAEPEIPIEFPDRRLGELASSVLGPSEPPDDDQPTRLVWGQTVTVRLRIGEHVQIPTGGPVPVAVRYVCDGKEDVLPTGTWKLEPGEAPVLLLALIGLDPDEPTQAVIGRATGIAGVLVLEEQPSGETSE